MVQLVKNLPAILETWVWSLGWEDPLEKGMATHSRILAWRIPWITKSWFGLSPLYSKDYYYYYYCYFLMVGWHHRLDGHEFEQALGVGDGQGSLVCCSPWGCKELDMTEKLNWTGFKIIYEVHVSKIISRNEKMAWKKKGKNIYSLYGYGQELLVWQMRL